MTFFDLFKKKRLERKAYKWYVLNQDENFPFSDNNLIIGKTINGKEIYFNLMSI